MVKVSCGEHSVGRARVVPEVNRSSNNTTFPQAPLLGVSSVTANLKHSTQDFAIVEGAVLVFRHEPSPRAPLGVFVRQRALLAWPGVEQALVVQLQRVRPLAGQVHHAREEERIVALIRT
jgi:hypothetical protein